MDKEQLDFKVGDQVFVQAREPMPNSMKRDLGKPQIITVAQDPYYEFESGWSVNLAMGDRLWKE